MARDAIRTASLLVMDGLSFLLAEYSNSPEAALGYAGLPFRGAGVVDAYASTIDGYGYGHVFYFELVDGFHAEVGEGEDLAALDGFGDEIGCSTYGHEVDGLIVADGFDGGFASLSFADHAIEACFGEHLAGELVHACGGGGAGWANGFVAYGVDRADVVDEAALEVDGELFAAVEHVGHAFVGGVAAGEELAGEEEDFAGLPGEDFVVGDAVEVYSSCFRDVVGEAGPGFERGWIERYGAAAVKVNVCVASGGTVGNHGYGKVRGVRGVVEDLDIEDGG